MADTEVATKNDLAVIKVLTPAIVFAPGGVEDVLSKIFAEVKSVKTDISTPGGRQAVASLAYKVARSKTFLDEMGKELVAEWKTKSSAVDAERRTIRERLDALKDEVRKPLTDWENADKDRVAAHETALADIEALAVLGSEPTAAECAARLTALASRPPRDWQEFAARADSAAALAKASLTQSLDERARPNISTPSPPSASPCRC
jgi:colicin import membrane protein